MSNSVKSTSFFNEHKLVVINGAFSKKATAEEILEVINKEDLASAKDITLLFSEVGTAKDFSVKSRELYKTITDKNSVVKIFEPLEGTALNRWIRREVEVRGCSISSQALGKLINIAGNDTWFLISEIDKLSVYRGMGEIGSDDIDILVSLTKELNIFDLIDAVGSGRSKKAFELLYRELRTGRDPYYVLTMITYQFRNILLIKDLSGRGISQPEIAKKTGIHPFVIKKAIGSINSFNIQDIKNIYGYLCSIDSGFKSDKLNLENALYTIILGDVFT